MKQFPGFGRSAMLLAGIGCLAIGFAAGVFAAGEGGMIVTPFAKAKFQPVDPKQPAGAQIAVLRGDPASGPSSMLMRQARGTSAMHVHSSDYDLVLIKGQMKHWRPGEVERDTAVLEPGSYWFQPGNEPHAGSCLTDECVMYVQWNGKRDGRVVDTR
jgi:quercetin dioxygenase-like cupin family protein